MRNAYRRTNPSPLFLPSKYSKVAELRFRCNLCLADSAPPPYRNSLYEVRWVGEEAFHSAAHQREK
ncbi:hypothetical protein RND71_002089 [Anisodus tanguticus]|uniref:Uncharacterized protein n=1 Tax=Anisodus tanguticus TaxID=243964 RepID=A0AAE1VSS2_9SOLA|nr:hypothetical protein RND71_002089 [Anisodus tanguticus]